MAHAAIDPADLEIQWDKLLGTGGSGKVFRGVLKSYADGAQQTTLVAVKVLDDNSSTQKGKAQVENEIHMLTTALSQCNSVCKLFGSCVKEDRLCIVLKLYEKSLADFQSEHQGGKLPLALVVKIGKQVSSALALLHDDAHVAHFDIKPENVLMTREGNWVLADFSIAHQFKAHEKNFKLPQDCYGSDRYMSPEQVLCSGPGASYSADVWGLGCTLLHLVTGKVPFSNLGKVNDVNNALINNKTPYIPDTIEPRLHGILSGCFKIHPSSRSTAKALRATLSQLDHLLAVEAGEQSGVPEEVLACSEFTKSTGSLAAEDAAAAAANEPEQADLLGLNGPSEVDLLGIDIPVPTPAPPLSSREHEPGSGYIAAKSDGIRRMGDGGVPFGIGSDGPTTVVVTACSDGTLGVNCLYRSCNRVLKYSGKAEDSMQMLGVALVPALDPSRGVGEAVSVNASGILSWWNLDEGRVSVSGELSNAGRSVAATKDVTVVGKADSTLAVWQFTAATTSSYEAAVLRTCDVNVKPERVATPTMQAPKGKSNNKIWDLSFEQPWLESQGGTWLAGATSGGCLAIWDTTTWQQKFCNQASSNQVVYSCCAMPGSGMVAVACRGSQLVRVWDCRQQDNVAAVMRCQLSDHGKAESHVYCISTVPSSGGVMPSQLLFGSNTGRLYVWDLRSPAHLWSVGKLRDGIILGCAASPDGRRIVAGGAQLAMLDWTQQLTGQLKTPLSPGSTVELWECPWNKPMYLFPTRASKPTVVRAVCGDIVSGNLLTQAFPEVT